MSEDTDDPNGADYPTADETDVIRYNWHDSERPSVAIVEAVAVATNRRPTELPPLQRTVDLDAVDALLTDGTGALLHISFRYEEMDITVRADGTIEVQTPY